MLDDREDSPGDLVHQGNEKQWREKFCEDVGHSMECVEETIDDMVSLMKKISDAFGGVPLEHMVDGIPVEKFDKHLRAILKEKECTCKKT